MTQPTKTTKKQDKTSVRSQLRTLRYAIQKLSDKNPNEKMNEFKLGFVNQTLEKCNELLGENKPYDSFTTFDVAMLPTNSDVVVILDVYGTAMEELKS